MAEGVSPFSIMAVTFTNKAAREMRERIEGMVGESARHLKMGTFHSIAARWLRMHGGEIGIERDFVIYDDADQLSAMKALMKEHDVDPQQIAPRTVLNKISRFKEQLTEAHEVKLTGTYMDNLVAKLYKAYTERLRSNHALDFDDLLLFAVKLLQEANDVRERLQNQIQFIFVDEYQDVNLAQYLMIKILAEKHQNLMVVGDDDQSIYSWRGADTALMKKFKSDYPKAKITILAQNYRSTQNILDAANALILNNSNRTHKDLWCDKGKGEKVKLRQVLNERQEAMLIADTIQSAIAHRTRAYKDFGILYRTNAQSRILEEVFLLENIPHIIVGGQRFYQRAEIKDAIAYLRLVHNPADDSAFDRVINNPPRGLGNKTIAMINEYAQVGTPKVEALNHLVYETETITGKARLGAFNFLDSLASARNLFEETRLVAGAINEVLKRSTYLQTLKDKNTDEAESRVENLMELISVASEHDEAYMEASAEESLSLFLESVALASDVDGLKESGEAVTLMTCHAAKGLEFPVVFVTGLEENLFPHSRAKEADADMQEERRLFYVAMTRAMDELYLTYALERSIMGSFSATLPSKFLKEIPRECLDERYLDSSRSPFSSSLRSTNAYGRQRTAPSFDSIDDYDYTESADSDFSDQSDRRFPKPVSTLPFKIGDHVKHPKFGLGVVMACEPTASDHAVTIVFNAEHGVKKLMAKLAKLEINAE